MARSNNDRLPTSHQESIAVAIALCDDENSELISNLVETDLFDEPFDSIISRCIEHRQVHKRSPGKSHIDDVFADVLEDKQHKLYNLYHSVISKMVQQADKLDTGFVLDAVSSFVYSRRWRAGIATLVERYQRGGNNTIADLEELSRKNLKIRDEQRDYGFSLADNRALGFLDRDEQEFCRIGIKELDERHVVPTKQEMMAFLSPPNRGKSLFLVHCGKYALLKGWRVLHYSLENSEEMTAQRYFQNLFNGVRRRGSYRFTVLSGGDDERDTGLKLTTETLTPDFIVENTEQTYAFLNDKVRDHWKSKLSNLRIRRFPSGRLSFSMLEQDLDALRIAHRFEPDLLMIDMPQLMKKPAQREDYTALDQLFTDLRGLAVDRNLALVVPQQGNRSSNTAKSVQAQHGSGSFGVFGIADNLITYSQTMSEEAYGLARLYTQKVRNDKARTTILITQHYDSAQFCMSSYPMTSRARDSVKEYIGYQSGETDGDDDEYESGGNARKKARSS